MRKHTILQSDEKHYRKLETLCHVNSHQRNRRAAVVPVCVRYQSGVVDKIPEAVLLLLVIVDGGVDELLEVLKPRLCLIRSLKAKSVCISGILSGRDDHVRY